MASVPTESGGGVNLLLNPPQQERWSLTARWGEPNSGPLRFTASFCWRFSECQGRLNKSLSWLCCVCLRTTCTFLCGCLLLAVYGEVCAASEWLESPFVRCSGCHVSYWGVGGVGCGGGWWRPSVSPSPRHSASDSQSEEGCLMWAQTDKSLLTPHNQVVPPAGWPSARGPPKLTVHWWGGPCPPLALGGIIAHILHISVFILLPRGMLVDVLHPPHLQPFIG